MLLRSGTPMVLVGTNNAEKGFEELLSAIWAARSAQLRVQPDSSESAASSGDSVKAQKAEK
jgi:hypothetical protein